VRFLPSIHHVMSVWFRADADAGPLCVSSLDSPVLPPPSLYSLFRQRKGYFSATDLSAPAWCFLQYDYGLRGSRNLPLALRPLSFVSARGREIKPDVKQAETNAKIMEAGTEVHKKLEREIHPVQIRVEVDTKEERYGLRILNMVASIEALIHLGICVSLPRCLPSISSR
jgi:exonuclease V